MLLFVALGAAGEDARPERLHASTTHGVLRMDVYGFKGRVPGPLNEERRLAHG